MLPEIVRTAGEPSGVEESPLPCPCLAGHHDTSENVIEELNRVGGEEGLKLPPLSWSVASHWRAVGNAEQQNKRCDGRTSLPSDPH